MSPAAMVHGKGYRPHIDGLRAIAVLAVVAYHAHVPGFGGGFVGVDVFFVISGFLITGLLFREFEETGDISLSGFYERRVRRLLPALLLVLAATLLLGAVFLTPVGGEQQSLARSAIATLALVSNVFFARNTGDYFDTHADAFPLLHTWSLSVEEQFYLAWPLALWAIACLARRRKRDEAAAVRRALIVVTVLSLTLSMYSTGLQPSFAFYGSPTRAWEFGLGGLVFFLLRNRTRPVAHAWTIAMFGFFAIAASVFGYRADMAFPGYLAMLPAFGAAAVILACDSAPRGWPARLLSLRPLVFVGLLSYSLYLWHWPLLAIARVHTLGEIDSSGTAVLCFVALLLAWLTYRFVENPIRQKQIGFMATRRKAFAGGLGLSLAVIAASGALGAWAKTGGLARPENATASAALAAMRKVRLACWQQRPYSGRLLSLPSCDQPVGKVPVLLVWGDSHASHLMPMVSAFAAAKDSAARIRFMPECPPLQDYSPTLIGVDRSPGCEQFNRDVLSEIARLRPRLKAVVVAAHWPPYVRNHAAELAAVSGLRATLSGLQRLGIRTLLVAPVPEFPHDVPACVARRSVSECGAARSVVERDRQRAVATLARTAAEFPDVRMVDPLETLCPVALCLPMAGGEVLFSDSHHLSVTGSMALLPQFSSELDWASADRSVTATTTVQAAN